MQHDKDSFETLAPKAAYWYEAVSRNAPHYSEASTNRKNYPTWYKRYNLNPEEDSQAALSRAKAGERYMQWMIVHKWQSGLLHSFAWPQDNLACMATGGSSWQLPAAWTQKSSVKNKVVHFLNTNQLTVNSEPNGGCSEEMAAQSGYWETHWGCLIWHH